jgi:hypothetical protein
MIRIRCDGMLHSAFLVRIYQAARGGGKHGVAHKFIPINALGPEDIPSAFETLDQRGDLLLGEGLETRGHDAPNDDAASIKKFSDGGGVRGKNFRLFICRMMPGKYSAACTYISS